MFRSFFFGNDAKKPRAEISEISALGSELSYRDSNPKRQNQNLLCYHYTIAQSGARKRCKDSGSFVKRQIFRQ